MTVTTAKHRTSSILATAPSRWRLSPVAAERRVVTSPAEATRLASLDDESLALAVERQAHFMLSKMQVVGPTGIVPISGLS
jgi:hypothetical protein